MFAASQGLRHTHSPQFAPRLAQVILGVMPWDEGYFPRSMDNLAPVVRTKAIEIANALLAEGYEEGQAIRIAISQAKRWAVGQRSPPRSGKRTGLAKP